MENRTVHRTLRLATSLAAVLVCAAAAAAPPSNPTEVVLKDVTFRGAGGSTVKLVKAAGNDAVAVDGASALIGFEKIAQKAAGKAALSSCTFVLRAIDKKAHRVSFAFGKLGTVSLTEGESDAWLMPTFAGAKSYGVQVFDKGKLTKTLSGQTTPLTLKDFDTVHDGDVDSLGFDLTFAREQKDAWSVTLTHADTVVVLTPEGVTRTLADAPAQIGVQTTGVEDGFVLIREGITVSPL
jgi:hypothetical protein